MKRIFAGAPQPKSLLYVRARCAVYIAMSSGAANSKPSQLNCEQVAPGRVARPWNSDVFVSHTTMAKWRRLYHESVAAVFARRLY
jgi:hypothetical protein